MKCAFCENPLNNSDEHIILDCLNGKLHSKDIICSSCNKFFGDNLDKIAKKFFNVILLFLNFKNASGEYVEDIREENQFLFQKNSSPKQVKLDIKAFNVKGKKLITISGNEKDTLNYYAKYVKKLEGLGIKLIAETKEKISKSKPLKKKVEFKTSTEIDILLNKIAIEYCAYNNIKTDKISSLALKTRGLDKNLSNVYYCNLNEEIRKFKSGEITHFIVLKKIKNKLIAYIELFNIICCAVVLDDNYREKNILYSFYQDAISGEKFKKHPNINNKEIISLLDTKVNKNADFNTLASKLFVRKREKDFKEIFDRKLKIILDSLIHLRDNKKITSKEFKQKYIQESTQLLAELQIENPYLFDDIDDANNDELNYLHSNIREEQFDEFNEEFQKFIGNSVKFDNGATYVIEELSKIPVASQKGILILRVNIVLFNGVDRKYIPYRTFFEGITQTNNH